MITGSIQPKHGVCQTRVVTYNVLSPGYCSASIFPKCSPDHVAAEYRFAKLTSKLVHECGDNAIICLQEVSLEWAGRLTAFFAAWDYTFVHCNYSGRQSGYMGVGIAFPRESFALEETRTIHVADSKRGGWLDLSKFKEKKAGPARGPGGLLARVAEDAAQPPAPRFHAPLRILAWIASLVPAYASALRQALRRAWSALWVSDAADVKEPEPSAWDLAHKSPNLMVTVLLRSTYGSFTPFVVATFHMPCQFLRPEAMMIHATLAFQALEAAYPAKYPTIFAGDFNIKPTSPPYDMITSTDRDNLMLVVHDPDEPAVHGKLAFTLVPAYIGDPFWYNLARGPFKSAYATVNGAEPSFTVMAWNTFGEDKQFRSTIDYIFYRDGDVPHATVRPTSVMDLSPVYDELKAEGALSLPTKDECSDHLMIAADFDISN